MSPLPASQPPASSPPVNPSPHSSPPAPPLLASQPPVITLCDLVKIFPSAPLGTPPALGGITAAVPAGSIVGLVGPDAAGKTTLMRLLAGLLLPTSGTVTLATHDIGYMPQRFGLYEDLSVWDNLTLHAELRGLEGKQRAHMFQTLLAFTSLAPFVRRLAGRLSGGMKQKLGLACALLTTPRLLLLDEPGVGVDPLSRRELWQMVSQLAGEGMSVLWSTAYMDEAQRCSHVLMLEQGRLVYEGPPSSFMDRVRGRVFQVQVGNGGAGPLLTALSQAHGVRDALIQGSKVRLLLAHGCSPESLTPLTGSPLVTVEPCLEDAYMDAVGGINQQPSVLGQMLREAGTGGVVGCDPASGGVFFAGQGRKESLSHTESFPSLSDTPLRHQHPASMSVPSESPPVIVAQGLTRVYGDFVAAADITFSVQAGKIFGLLGPNGAGKSTTFRMLCGLLRPTRGTCFVAGVDLLHAQEAARAKLGYMAQKFSLYGELTVVQNMQMVAELYGIPRADCAPRIVARMDALDIAACAKVKAGDLPLGLKQRLAMACATLHNPPVLFLDEPTSGVDPRTRRDFWKHINAMTQAGVAVLVTTHFMEEAEYCDEIALIIHGNMIARGTPDSLKTQCPHAFLDEAVSDPTLEDAFIAYIQADAHAARAALDPPGPPDPPDPPDAHSPHSPNSTGDTAPVASAISPTNTASPASGMGNERKGAGV